MEFRMQFLRTSVGFCLGWDELHPEFHCLCYYIFPDSRENQSDLLKCVLAPTFSQMNPVMRDASQSAQYYKCWKNVPEAAWGLSRSPSGCSVLISQGEERALSYNLFSPQCGRRRDDTWDINWEKLRYATIHIKQTDYENLGAGNSQRSDKSWSDFSRGNYPPLE